MHEASINNVFDSNPCVKEPFGEIKVAKFDESFICDEELIIIASVKFKNEIKEYIHNKLSNNKSGVLCVGLDSDKTF